MKTFLMAVGLATLLYSEANAQTQIIAHRGYWDIAGSAQNSIASLTQANEIKVYGTEFDVHVTKDGVAVLNHDDSIQGLNIQQSNYNDLKQLKLSNGEVLPTLKQFLIAAKATDIKLVLELKPHKSLQADERAARLVLDEVKQAGLESRVEYISFSLDACKIIKLLSPNATIAYLRGELTPDEIKSLGFSGFDYHYRVLQMHPDWVKKAHELGLTVNVWTVNEPEIMKEMISQKVDFITTDKPELLQELIK